MSESAQVVIGSEVPYSQLSALFTAVGWNRDQTKTAESLETMIKHTPHYACAFKQQTLVGFGRIISDEIFLFQLSDLIVHPDHRNQGIATAILKQLLASMPEGSDTLRMVEGFVKSSIWERLGYQAVPSERVMYAVLEKKIKK